MNYAFYYSRLIERARKRSLEGYTERHHVLPRCLGGGNEATNIVSLTPEEHYVAHQLLVKIYPKNRSVVYAAALMANTRCGSKFYGWLRRRLSQARSEDMRGKTQPTKIGNKYCVGRIASVETRERISKALRGKKLSPEHCNKMAQRMLGNKNTLGFKHTEEARAKMSASAPKSKSLAHRAKISAARISYWKRYREEKYVSSS